MLGYWETVERSMNIDRSLCEYFQRLSENGRFGMGEQTRLKILRFLLETNDWLIPEVSTQSAFGYVYSELSKLLNCAPGEEIADLTFLATNGYLDTRHADIIHLCPACTHYNLNFREVCTTCQSSDIAPTVHIHHFSCGYVGQVQQDPTTHRN